MTLYNAKGLIPGIYYSCSSWAGQALLGLIHPCVNTQALLQNSKHAKLPYHLAVIGPLGDPTPRMEHINEVCIQYQVQTPKILTNIVPEISSWTYPPVRNCPFLETKKQGLLDEEIQAIFLAHLERHPTVHIYTDGSKSTEGVGFAAVFPNITSSGRLTGEASIFTAELYAINAAVNEILKGTMDSNRFTIFSDSKCSPGTEIRFFFFSNCGQNQRTNSKSRRK